MHEPALHFGVVFMAFFAIMNPLANTPIFLGITEELDAATRRAVAARALLLAFAIVAVFSVGGKLVFDLFGITLPAFRIAGGLLIFLVGIHLLKGQASSVHTPTAEDHEKSREAALGVAVSPLALPILAGPGTIATAMNFAAGASPATIGLTLAAFLSVCAITYALFVTGERVVRVLGQNLVKVVSRLMGLILTVIGTQMVIDGVAGAIVHAGRG